LSHGTNRATVQIIIRKPAPTGSQVLVVLGAGTRSRSEKEESGRRRGATTTKASLLIVGSYLRQATVTL
jgi:hypothetical protein